MADDKDSKTEDPTGKKISDEFNKGNFAKAQEVGIAASLIAGFSIILFQGQSTAQRIGEWTRVYLTRIHEVRLNLDTASDQLNAAGTVIIEAITPLAGLSVLAAIVAGGLQSGFKLTLKKMEPSLNRFNPVNGFKKFFGKEVLTNFIFDFAKFAGIGAILYGILDRILSDPIFSSPVPLGHLGSFIIKTMLELFAYLIAFMVVIALAHILYQKRKVFDDMKMSKQEVKDEQKSSMGDQQVKGRQRQFARQILMQSMMRNVPTADVVVTNPTHYAIALRYVQGKDAAPIIVAMGKGHIAQRIKAIAAEHGIPQVENRPVARMLYSIGSVNQPIPAELYTVIAEILSFVYKKHRYFYHQLRLRRRADKMA